MAHTATIHMDWGVFFVVEVPAAPLQGRLPPGLRPAGPRAETALLTVNAVQFMGGGDGADLPETLEVDIGVGVPVDNSGHAGQPQADTAVHVLNIAASSAAYRDICRQSGYPLHATHDLTATRTSDGLSGQLSDSDGPILSFAGPPAPKAWRPFRRIGQDVIHDHRGEFRLNYVFSGNGLPASLTGSFTVTLHDHPFLPPFSPDAPPARLTDAFAIQPGTPAAVSFHTPEP